MKNHGLFSSLFIEQLKAEVHLNDAAKSRMTTLAQAWRTRFKDKTLNQNGSNQSADSLWETFLKQALSYLGFVPPSTSASPSVYPLYDDWSYSTCISVLYLVPPGSDINSTSVGSFYPAKLMAQLAKYKLNWGILTDGAVWRLYSTVSSRPYEDHVELNLELALAAMDESEYGLFERFFHKDSFIAEETEAPKTAPRNESVGVYTCRLDRNREQSEQVLEANVKTPFLAQIDEVLQYICNGFIFDTQKTGEEYSETERSAIFESAVKLIYRCLFLFYAEARRLLPSDPDKSELYLQLSIHTLCREARKFRWGQRRDTDQYDLWQRLKGLVSAVNEGDSEYGIMGYNGGLFDDREERFLGNHQLRNDFMFRALYLLAYVEPYNNEPDQEYAIPYKDLEVRHLGELYENILEYTVQLNDADRIRRRTKKGVEFPLASSTTKRSGETLIRKGDVYFGESALERKQTGSYYTPESLVRFLNRKTIIQPLHEIFDRNYRSRFEEFLTQIRTGHDAGARLGASHSAVAVIERFVQDDVLTFTVCDPAMGSGHFLVDATNRMTDLVVALLEEVPQVEGMAVNVTSQPNEWRRKITRHCIYGVDLNPLAVDLTKLSLWLNCFAAKHPLTFLDHHIRRGNSLIGIRTIEQLASIPERKKDSKKKNDPQLKLFNLNDLSAPLEIARQGLASITQIDEDDTVSQKALLSEAQAALVHLDPLADLFTAYLMDSGIRPDDYKNLFDRLAKRKSVVETLDPALPQLLESVRAYRARHTFFHWPLEFPDVFGPNAPGGFSATVGNPPWDIVKPNSQEFFLDYDSQFRSYDKQAASRISRQLMAANHIIARKWGEYCEGFAQQSVYFKEPQNYNYLGGGDINTFKLFLEQFFSVLRYGGRMGIVVPSGIYTDQGCQPLRELFFNRSRIELLYCFENRRAVFNIHRSFKFILFCTQKGGSTDSFKCAFMEHDPNLLPVIDTNALKMSVQQIKKFSPDTFSVMEFNSQRDIDVTSRIYGTWPLLGEKLRDTWNVKFRSELHMTNHSYLFKTTPTDCPLYEGKMIWLFDCAFDSPRYWLDRAEVEAALGDSAWEGKHYRVGFRDIAASTNERTLISSLVSPNYIGNTLPVVIPQNTARDSNGPNDVEAIWLSAILSSFCMDFVIRQKVTTHLNFFYMETMPVPRPIESNILKSHFGLIAKALRLLCVSEEFKNLWESLFSTTWQTPDFWYPPIAPIDTYGPVPEQEIRKQLRDEAQNLTPEWSHQCGVHDRLPDRRDTGDRAQLRAEIDAYVAHLYGLARDDFAYILDTFPVLRRKEEKVFGEYMSRRKCLEEYDRIGTILNAG